MDKAKGGGTELGLWPRREGTHTSRFGIALIGILVLPALGYPMSGMQMARDGHRVMISKDVGDERWAIVYDMDDHTAMGNVFFPSGAPPAFVWCMETGDDGNPDQRQMQMTFACYGADACPTDPCSSEEWTFIHDVMLPGGFFMPPQMSGPGMMSSEMPGPMP